LSELIDVRTDILAVVSVDPEVVVAETVGCDDEDVWL